MPKKTIGSQRFFYPEKLTGPRCLVRGRVRRVVYRRNPPRGPPAIAGGVGVAHTSTRSGSGMLRDSGKCLKCLRVNFWDHGTAPRELRTFAGVMVATRSRAVRARHAIGGAAASNNRRDRIRARTKKRRVRTRW